MHDKLEQKEEADRNWSEVVNYLNSVRMIELAFEEKCTAA